MTLPFDQFSRNTKNILSFSGGKDSAALYLLAMEQGIEFTPVFCDTGNEHPITLEYVRTFHEQTGGPKVAWLKADFKGEIQTRRMVIARDRRPRKRLWKTRDETGKVVKSVVKRVRYTNKVHNGQPI